MAGKKKLYRSRTERIIGGVCGGLADYFGLDPVLVRVLAVVSLMFGGAGLVAYILFWLLTPEEPPGE